MLAEEKGVLREYIVETMRIEWAEGQNIGEPDVLREVARRIGLDPEELLSSSTDPDHLAKLEANYQEAQALGVFGVPTFVIGDEIFWGQDRIDFVLEHLRELRLARC